MTLKYLSFSISIAFISWIVGMIVNTYIRKTDYYNKRLSNLNFIESDKLNYCIGLNYFKWIVKSTFFKFFNQKIKIDKKIEKVDSVNLRNEMTKSEIDHLVALVFVFIFAVVKSVKFDVIFGLTIMMVNVLMNLYPSLLQQDNKRRIDKLIQRI